MKYHRSPIMIVVTLGALLLSGGCDTPDTTSVESEEPPKAEAEEASSAEEPASEPESAATPGASEAMTEFHEMDGRKPVPLTPMMANHQRQNMRDHLVAIEQIVGAAAQKDFDGIEKAAEKIGSSPEMAQMCNHMGAGADGFTELALGFHETADGIIEAAEGEDYDGVMSALGDTINTCTSCHAQYKQKIVTEEVWAQKTGMGAPSGGAQQMHHGGGHH